LGSRYKQIAALQSIKAGFESPEHINDSYDTIPSRQIAKVIPSYSKVQDGTILAKRIGIDAISTQCLHFGKWVSKMIAFAKEGIR